MYRDRAVVLVAAPTTTTLTSSANPAAFGQYVTFTAAVAPVAPTTAAAGGTVTFTVDGGTAVPVALSGTKDLWLRKRIRVVIGRPISPSAGYDPASLTEVGYQAVKGLLPPYSEPVGRKFLRRRLTNLF